MINWFNMPSEGLSNGGQFEIKELTATENKVYEKDGEVYSKVTVNVEGGGGGTSDFSTATVDVTVNEDAVYILNAVGIFDERMLWVESFETGTATLVLYKGTFASNISSPEGYRISSATGTGGVTVSARPFGGFSITITGDGTLNVELATIS